MKFKNLGYVCGEGDQLQIGDGLLLATQVGPQGSHRKELHDEHKGRFGHDGFDFDNILMAEALRP